MKDEVAATRGKWELCKPYVRRNEPGHAMDGGDVVIPFRSDAEMEAILEVFRRHRPPKAAKP
jgi:hypothetical protein